MELNKEILLIYDKNIYLYDSTSFKSAELRYSKNHFTVATIPLNYIKTANFKLPKTLSEDELIIQSEIKMFNEFGLDSNKEYQIDFVKFEYNEEYILEVYAISQEDFENVFKESKNELDAIDLLFPKFLSYQLLYEKEILQKDKNDIFIHIGEETSYCAVYKNGFYIGNRTIDSLSVISKKIGLELSKLKDYLINKGIKRDRYELDEIHIYEE